MRHVTAWMLATYACAVLTAFNIAITAYGVLEIDIPTAGYGLIGTLFWLMVTALVYSMAIPRYRVKQAGDTDEMDPFARYMITIFDKED